MAVVCKTNRAGFDSRGSRWAARSLLVEGFFDLLGEALVVVGDRHRHAERRVADHLARVLRQRFATDERDVAHVLDAIPERWTRPLGGVGERRVVVTRTLDRPVQVSRAAD